jgi:hypothetical protein
MDYVDGFIITNKRRAAWLQKVSHLGQTNAITSMCRHLAFSRIISFPQEITNATLNLNPRKAIACFWKIMNFPYSIIM